MNWDQFSDYINEREAYLNPCATRSLKAILFDGTTIEEHYKKIFDGGEKLDIDRFKFRSPFQLDRDRILGSPIFLRLSQKTQLLTSRKGLIENRFTHTMRVVQISKSICYGLKLNQDLVEAIAYGHDVGHTAFAHMGERTLNEWLKDKLPKSLHEQPDLFKDENIQPILQKIEPKSRNLFSKYFTFGNDLKEEFFMHGRQSYRLLTFKRLYVNSSYANYINYTRPVLFGIWRHSYEENTKTDLNFSYSVDLKEGTKGKLGHDDLTLEAQAVRLADDIAWAVTDLYEGLKEGLVKVGDIRNAMDGLEPGENHVSLSRNEIINNFEIGSLSPIYTYFISNIINTNMGKLKDSQTPKCTLEISEPVRSDLIALMSLVRKKIHMPSPVGRADEMHKSMIKSLCDWYFLHENDFNNEIKSLREKKDFPMEEIPEDAIKDEIFRLSMIADFVSLLTDEEVYILSESLPFKVYF